MRSFIWHLWHGIERADSGGWSLLFAGVGLIAVTMLLPAWDHLQHLEVQQARLDEHLNHLTERHVNYEKLILAVETADPTLLQRLAWHELNLKPTGAEIFDAIAPLPASPAPAYQAWVEPRTAAPPPQEPSPIHPTIQWLIDRQTWLLSLGIMLIGLGLLSSLRAPHPTTAQSA